MILRRFMQHVTEQNWFAVVLDVLVVIVGIFLGMQVTEWNEERKNRKDAREFLVALHDDLLLAESASSRVFKRRLDTFEDLKNASGSLFSFDQTLTLSKAECTAIGNSNILNIVVGDLPSLAELQASGRIGIINDRVLRKAAITLQQRIRSRKEVMQQLHTATHDLLLLYPELVQVSSFYDPDLMEVNLGTTCAVENMRQNAGFMNSVSTNLDIYDAYLRDGLLPWKVAFDELHELTDDRLGYSHVKPAGEPSQ